MAYIKNSKSIYYNDVNLIAKPALIESRSEVPKELHRIIVSPMSAVVGLDFAKAATDLGLSVCQHKFCDIDTAVVRFSSVKNKKNLFVSIGLNDWDRAKELAEEGATNWLIDCANGYLPQIREVIYKLINSHKTDRLLIGNVMTDEGIELYKDFVKYIPEVIIRVGIAGGCFIPNSIVKTDIGLVEIQNIKIGDRVLTHTGEYGIVTNKFLYHKDEELKVVNGITCTKNHEFYVINKKYKDIVTEFNYQKYAEWISAENLTDNYFLIEL